MITKAALHGAKLLKKEAASGDGSACGKPFVVVEGGWEDGEGEGSAGVGAEGKEGKEEGDSAKAVSPHVQLWCAFVLMLTPRKTAPTPG